ncbi:transposase [Clostridium botulinum]|uniref:Transposase n=2 Tax=Clostridium botulinum TaxID=1491 RepID=A0A9Q1ZAP0_CLOBO|nr:RNA-guided endonuclease TnpB family protein [Clostridium botulinum]AEB77230.1 transposase, OrfB family [Clostridium botulinum BKT015925]KEH96232.1 transposase [Clostridium botulinum C/D str. Sp77]KOA80454.1 transposase [Clostridium botulinum]KOA81098.1 transposase [Clostridium botulinum]KOA84176.1 transposase [Clostridium botulinum]
MTTKKDDNTVQRVEKHMINQNHELYELLNHYTFLSKNLYNYANYQLRQVFILTSKLKEDEELTTEQHEYLNSINAKVNEFNELRKVNFEKAKQRAIKQGKELNKKLKLINYFNEDNKYLGYDFLEFLLKDGIDYKSLMSQVSQQTLKLLDKNWISFFESIKDWSKHKEKYNGRPKLPKYKKKNGKNILVFTNQNCKQKKGYIQFPKCFNKYELKTNINGNLQQVRILPRNKHYVIEVVYKIEKKEKLNDNGKYISIDIGLDNFATVVNNIGLKPIIINGKGLKSINKYYNKKLSYYKEIAKRMNNLDYTNRMNRLTIKRNNKIIDFVHKASKKVIDYALANNINTIIVGNNKDWKRESNMSKVVNQSFVGIPHQEFINKLIYKCENVGLNIIITEESYTSGTSFLDNELPNKENYNKKRRVYRGLFVSNNGVKINADVNGAYQIMRKVLSNVKADEIEGVGLHPIRVNIA